MSRRGTLGGQVRLLATGLTRETADERLDGYGEVCCKPESAEWLDRRLAQGVNA